MTTLAGEADVALLARSEGQPRERVVEGGDERQHCWSHCFDALNGALENVLATLQRYASHFDRPA